uniref:Uncharacterized protein n=1 Tax=Lactuca sativa TaxID=4236 RepID=A0A9R1UZN0_LACSA|nr:hypothetical protein LSAT_V11C700369760 [Lactuca sativa]
MGKFVFPYGSVQCIIQRRTKLPITMLIDIFREDMQQWWCQRHNVGYERKNDVTEYAKKFINKRINKSFAFWLYQIDQSRYKVTDQMKNDIVNLESRYYICGKCQLLVHVCHRTFRMKSYRSAYLEVVFPVPVLAEYEQPDEVMVVLPPFMDKR